jgi:hypothetical protein
MEVLSQAAPTKNAYAGFNQTKEKVKKRKQINSLPKHIRQNLDKV